MNNMLKVLLEKKEIMQEHVGNVNREMETLRKNKKIARNYKTKQHIINRNKEYFDGFFSKLDS